MQDDLSVARDEQLKIKERFLAVQVCACLSLSLSLSLSLCLSVCLSVCLSPPLFLFFVPFHRDRDRQRQRQSPTLSGLAFIRLTTLRISPMRSF